MRTPATLVPDAGWAEQVRRQRSQGQWPFTRDESRHFAAFA